MKRKRKWLILLCLLLLLLAIWMWSVSGRNVPVDVIGAYSENDVAEIIAAVKCEMRRQILPSFSWQSIKSMPKAIKRFSCIKRFTIVPDDQKIRSAYIFVWEDTNGLPTFRSLSNGWFGSNAALTVLQIDGLAQSNATWFWLVNGSNGWKTLPAKAF